MLRSVAVAGFEEHVVVVVAAAAVAAAAATTWLSVVLVRVPAFALAVVAKPRSNPATQHPVAAAAAAVVRVSRASSIDLGECW